MSEENNEQEDRSVNENLFEGEKCRSCGSSNIVIKGYFEETISKVYKYHFHCTHCGKTYNGSIPVPSNF